MSDRQTTDTEWREADAALAAACANPHISEAEYQTVRARWTAARIARDSKIREALHGKR